MATALKKIPFVSRLYPSILKRWPNAPLISGYRIRSHRGVSLILDYRNALDRNVGLRGAYEEKQLDYFLPRMKAGACDIFLDIGACCGLYALQAAKADAAREIHAFEPDPRNFSHMMGNVMINEFSDRVQAHAFALSDKAGTVLFELGDNTKTGLSKVVGESGGARTRTVECRRADDVFTCKGKKIFVKLDVEGHELAVLRGAETLLRDNDCVLQIEAWRDNAPALIAHMAALGYRNTHVIDDDHYFEK